MKRFFKFLLTLVLNIFILQSQSFSQTVSEITIPNDVNKVNFIVKGAAGGETYLRSYNILTNTVSVCNQFGGKGAVVEASFAVGNGANEIPANSTLRLIEGKQPYSAYKDAILGVGTLGSAGGGGSAVLYKAPSSSIWVILAVAGGGGGSYSGMAAYDCVGSRFGISASLFEYGYSGGILNLGGVTVGTNGSGATNGNGGEGGGVNQSASGGGGGAFTDGTSNLNCSINGQTAGGKKGFPNGGAASTCFATIVSAGFGGGGFGAGGQGRDAGGGGGGYSGGGGGESFFGGGGGGSYVNGFASISQYRVLNSVREDGDVIYGFEYTACAGHSLTSSIGTVTNVGCKGGNNGAAIINYTTTHPASTTFEWFPLSVSGQGTNSVSNLSAGTYFCKVKLTNPSGGTCDSMLYTIVITEPNVLASSTDSISQAKCNGASNGYIRIKISGGTKPYSSTLGVVNNADSTITIINLAAGNYSTTITDAKGCTKTHSFTITQPGIITNNRVYVNKNATGNNSGESWANAFVDLQSALALSRNCTGIGINQIWVAKGTYTPTSDNNRSASFLVNGNVTVYGGFAGNETTLTARNVGQNNTFLSGNIGNIAINTDNSYHVITMNGVSNTAKIDGFIIQDGYNANATGVDTLGAGLYLYNTASTSNNVLIQNCVFRNNFSKQAAAVANDSRASNNAANASKIALENCLLYNNNITPGNQGAAVANIGNIPSYGEVKLNNCTLTQNTDGVNHLQILKVGDAYIYIFNSIVLGAKNYNAISPNLCTINSCITTATGVVYPPLTGINVVEDRPFVNAANPEGIDGKLMTADDGLAQQSCSNTVNAGNNTYMGGYTTDIAGNPRRYNNATLDIGAYELQGTASAAPATIFVKANAATGGNGASWASAFNNLQDALTLANNCTDISEIWVAAGTYTPSTADVTKSFSMVSNVKIYGGFAGTEATLAQRDWVNNKSILSGEIGTTGLADNSYHVVKNTNITNALLNGFSVERGYAFAGGINNLGGGIYNSGVTNTKFENIYFNTNRANGGGAMYNTNSPVDIQNCVFDVNSALSFGTGGAIYNSASNSTVTNCVFNANTSDVGAGAIFNNSSNTTVRYSTFNKNETSFSTQASGIQNNTNSTLTMTNTIMWDTVGGANIVNTNGGIAAVTYSNIQKSGAAYTGTGNVNVNPIFNDPTNGNGNDNKWFTIDDGLHLRKCVTTISNAATNIVGITSDIIGAARPQGTAPAMGAYETEILPNQLYPPSITKLYVKPTGIVTNAGSSWIDALKEVGEAIRIATQNTQIKEIWVAAGTYKPIYDEFYNACGANARDKTFLIPNGVKIYGGFAGTENNIAQANPTDNPTILSGDIGVVNNQLDNVYHVVCINNPTVATELNGCTITKGQGEFTGNNIIFLNLGLSPWQAYGAGVFINQGGENVKITNCNITFNEGDPNTLGGGIFSNNSSPIIENTRIQSNLAGNGAGCYITGSGPQFNRVIFASNSVYTNGIGGAINSYNDSNMVINKSVFDYNVATTGGAIYRNTNGPLNITNTIFNNNYSSAEGAVLYQGSGTTNFTNCTIKPNTTTTASTFWVGSSGLNLVNNIAYYSGTVPPLFNNNTSANFTVNNSNIKTTEILNGSNNINADPLFTNLNNPAGADGIWFTADDGLQLPCNSPSVNTGTNTNAPLDDILGNSFIGGNKDMGAYESKATVPTAPTPTSFGATQIQTGTTQYGDCSNFIATVTSSGSIPIAGITSAKVWVEFIQNNGYVKRHYEITPANFASFYTGTVTLYFTQQEFDDFNAVNTIKLPTNGNDAVGKANMLIEKRGGFSNNATGLPSSYTGTISNIDPVDANIVWSNTYSRWEVTFDVTGFSGFFVKTQTVVLPVKWLSISGNVSADKKAIINFKVEEYNVAKYDVEKSTNGADFISIGTLISKGNGINNYDFTENIILSGVAYYRIKQIDNNGKIEYSTIIKLSNKENISFTVYPNPTTGNLFIRTNGLHKKAILTDITGKILQQVFINQQVTSIDFSNYNSGVYIIKTDNGEYQKIIKQ